MKNIFLSIPYHAKLKYISLRNSQIGDYGLYLLLFQLQTEEKLRIEYLNLSGNKISIVGIQHLSEYLEDYNPYLKTLDISYNNLVDQGVQELAQSIKKRHMNMYESDFYRLQYKVYLPLLGLNISKVKMGDKGFWNLINVLKEIQIKNS